MLSQKFVHEITNDEEYLIKILNENQRIMRKERTRYFIVNVTLAAFSFFTAMLSAAFVALCVKNTHIKD